MDWQNTAKLLLGRKPIKEIGTLPLPISVNSLDDLTKTEAKF